MNVPAPTEGETDAEMMRKVGKGDGLRGQYYGSEIMIGDDGSDRGQYYGRGGMATCTCRTCIHAYIQTYNFVGVGNSTTCARHVETATFEI